MLYILGQNNRELSNSIKAATTTERMSSTGQIESTTTIVSIEETSEDEGEQDKQHDPDFLHRRRDQRDASFVRNLAAGRLTTPTRSDRKHTNDSRDSYTFKGTNDKLHQHDSKAIHLHSS